MILEDWLGVEFGRHWQVNKQTNKPDQRETVGRSPSGGNTEHDKFSRTGIVANKENKEQQQLAQIILQLETRRRLTSAKTRSARVASDDANAAYFH